MAKSDKTNSGKSGPKPSKETPKKAVSKPKKQLEDDDELDDAEDDDINFFLPWSTQSLSLPAPQGSLKPWFWGPLLHGGVDINLSRFNATEEEEEEEEKEEENGEEKGPGVEEEE